MARINRDVIAALILLAIAGGAYISTFDIRVRNDGIMRADAWPKVIIAALAVLSVVYLIQALRMAAGERSAADGPSAGAGLAGWLRYYANPIFCFALYFAFLVTLPWLGVLFGGTLLVFLTLSVLGGWGPLKLLQHAVIAVVAIGSMWAIFTYALRVALPEGEILPLILPR